MTFGKDKVVLLKAVMALMLVADHLTFHVSSPLLAPMRETGAPIVSIFLFLSGYGLAKSYENKGQAYLGTFLKHRVWRVLLPALLALLFYYILLWNPNRNYWDELRQMVLYGSPMLPYSWFVPVIIYLYLVWYLAYRYVGARWRNWVVLAGTLFQMVLTMAVGYDRCWWVCSLAFPAGVLFSQNGRTVFAFCEKSLIRYAAALLATVVLFLGCYLPRNQYLWTLCYVFIPIIVVLLAAKLPIEKLKVPVVVFLASISYEVYLCQGIPMDFFENTLPVAKPLAYVLMVYIATILLAYAVKRLSDLIYNKCQTQSR